MATKITINISKKVPGPLDYSSIQASVSIEREISHGEDVLAAAAALQVQAEAAVDQQLGIAAPQAKSPPAGGAHVTNPGPRAATPPPLPSQPYPVNGQRRGPAPVTDSQLRYLQKLITDTGTSLPAILEHHQVGSLRDLSCKDAAGLIDELKARVPA